MSDRDEEELHEPIIVQLDRIKAYLGFANDAEFAIALGVRPNVYSKWRRGQKPAFHVICNGMRRIGIRLDYFMAPGRLPEDYVVDKAALQRDVDIGSLRVGIAQRDKRITELEGALNQAIATWRDIRRLLPSDVPPEQ